MPSMFKADVGNISYKTPAPTLAKLFSVYGLVDEVVPSDKLMERTLDATGYEEASLVSLSTCDYSRVQQLVDNTAKMARARRVAVSLPSLRLDSFSVGLADKVAGERRTGQRRRRCGPHRAAARR